MPDLPLRRLLVAFICLVTPASGRAQSPLLLNLHASCTGPIAVSPDGRYIASAGGDIVQLYDVRTRKVRYLRPAGTTEQYSNYRMGCHALAFSPDSKTLANGGAEMGQYAAINTWDTATGAHLKTFALSTVGQHLSYMPDGTKIVAAGDDNRIHVWNARTGKELKSIPGPGGPIYDLALSPDGRRVAIGTVVPHCVLQVRDLRSGRAVWTTSITGEGIASPLAFSPNGTELARGGQYNAIYLHDARTGRLRATLSDPVPAAMQHFSGADAGRVIAYSPDNRFLAGGGIYRAVVWSTRKHKVILRLQNAGEPLAFLPGGKALVATQCDVPAPHAPHAHSYLMRPARKDGNVAIWPVR